jgi:hypothetical protein
MFMPLFVAMPINPCESLCMSQIILLFSFEFSVVNCSNTFVVGLYRNNPLLSVAINNSSALIKRSFLINNSLIFVLKGRLIFDIE